MRAARGFTLLEMIVVVVLFAAISALAASVVSRNLPAQQLQRATREIAAQLRYTRARAISTGTAQVFVLDTRTRAWRAPDRHHGEVPASIQVVATAAKGEQEGDQTAVVRFFPEGAATGGRFVLRRDRAAWQIDIEWLTGEVRVTRAGAGR
ncbi:GspH/FimT family pseudopilin [soil metagenome]